MIDVRVSVMVLRGLLLGVVWCGVVGVGVAVGAPAGAPLFGSGFGVVPGSFTADSLNVDGTLDIQAGSHPFEATTSFSFRPLFGTSFADGDVKDVIVDLPPGFVGNPQAVSVCQPSRLTAAAPGNCPADSMIGVATVFLNGGAAAAQPVYNLVPETGHPAEFGFTVFAQPGAGAGGAPVILYAGVRPPNVSTGVGYALRVSTPGIPQNGSDATINSATITGVSLTFWGVPADHNGGGSSRVPFLTNPTDCSASAAGRTATLTVDSWQNPGRVNTDGSPDFSDPAWSSSTAVAPVLTGCDRLAFNPTFSVTPDTTRADTPSGDSAVTLSVPQTSDPGIPATPELKDVTVALPAGLSLNPGAGDGLAGCSDAQAAFYSSDPMGCPLASQVGTVSVSTPLLKLPLAGEVFLGAPLNTDPLSGGMFRLFLQIEGAGILVKIPGSVTADPSTGQLTATFLKNPEVPFSDLTLTFKGGDRATFINPQACGAAVLTTDMTAWSSNGPVGTPDANPLASFVVDWDGAGGVCPASLPFAPSFLAQTTYPTAGAFTPFTLTFSRAAQQQELSQIGIVMPPGLAGMLSAIPLCDEPQASQGACPQASKIGTATAGAGTGSHPLYLSGPVYLTGPYHGAPFGLSVVIHAAAGPFDLGMVVVRSAINVDPHTAQLTITSDPLPQILDGIPFRLQTINVTVDQPGFMFNPTNCSQQSITARIASTLGASAQVSSPFEVGGCQNLPFTPKLTASSSAKTSRANGASLSVQIGYAPGQANVRSVAVNLPKQLPSRLTTIQKACPDSTFNTNPAACNPGSLVGIATAVSPVLPVKVRGPAYLVSHGGAAFPDLVLVLEGYGVRLDLTGSIFISSKGVTSSTFKSVPDLPINSFELDLPTGPHSALTANGSLCTHPLTMPTTITGQNGGQIKQTTKIKVSGCPKKHKTNTKKKAKSKARKASHHTTRASHHPTRLGANQ